MDEAEYLLKMIEDKNASIRQVAVSRISDSSILSKFINDEDNEVRNIISEKIDISYLPQMMKDKCFAIRLNVSKRIDKQYLLQMLNDEHSDIILTEIAKRIDSEYLFHILNNKYYGKTFTIINIIINRIDKKYLYLFIGRSLHEDLNQLLIDRFKNELNLDFEKFTSYHLSLIQEEDEFIKKAAIRKYKEIAPFFIKDKSSSVRCIVAECIDVFYLPQMMDDENEVIRIYIARRIDSSYLPQMMNDKDYVVRRIVAERIDEKYLYQMINDSYWSVRYRVVDRIDVKKYFNETELANIINKENNREVLLKILDQIDFKPTIQSCFKNDSYIKEYIDKRFPELEEHKPTETHKINCKICNKN